MPNDGTFSIRIVDQDGRGIGGAEVTCKYKRLRMGEISDTFRHN